MSNSDLVRASRDGDQFHYLWAARRCLRLLSSASDLVAISIEGASTAENGPDEALDAGDVLIDVGEYYGSEAVEKAKLIRYIQLKHSTRNASLPWTVSGLKKTLLGFAERYVALQRSRGVATLGDRLEFCFVSNRPISSDLLEVVNDVATEKIPRHPKELKQLEEYTGLSGASLSSFLRLLRIEGGHEGYWDQRNILTQDISGYLPDADADAPIQLKELVTRKALSESAENQTITKVDVLRALKTDESRLFPAPSLIQVADDIVTRRQEAGLIKQIANADRSVIVHAAGGVGKSVFSTRIESRLPVGSVCIVYDCFGNGQYRSASAYRHRHKDALVQIANELAGKGLCHPLIPTVNAEPASYVKAFLYRLRQSIGLLRANCPDALLCIVIDAADNAQMAAEEIGESRSFARDLIREEMPDGVRLVMLCRTHRQVLLNPPPHVLSLKLESFRRTETAAHLRRFFPDATEQDIDEFHRLSSHNPRVQATALSREAELPEILRALGPNPKTVEDTIASLLEDVVAELRDKAGPMESPKIDLLCAGLAALKPLIPIPVLASISGVEESAVHSFAVDLGRPLIVIGNTIQFFDEPAETWFRDRFRPKTTQLASFIAILKPLAATSAYVASVLPQLMLEAGEFAELVDLALSSESLPASSPVEKRDIALQRLQFALKASLRAKRYSDATKIALRAGGETAGGERQQKLLQANTDLASVFMDADRIQEIVSRRTFGGGWMGSHHVYEAGLMSGRTELSGDARSRLRMAHEWLRNWSHLSDEQRDRERILDNDIAEFAMAHLNLHGAGDCVSLLKSWKLREVTFRAGRILARRLVDHGRYDDLNQLAFAAGNNLCLVLAIARELRDVYKNPPKEVTERALRILLNPRVKLNSDYWDSRETVLGAVTALVESGLSYFAHDELSELLARYLPDSPPRGLASRYSDSRFPLLRAYTLQATLSGRTLDLIDLAYPELRKQLENTHSHYTGGEVQGFKRDVGALLPWHQLWARVLLGQVQSSDLSAAIADAKSTSSKAVSYGEESNTSDEIARLWLGALVQAKDIDVSLIKDFNSWVDSLKRPLFTTTLSYLARLCARRSGMEQYAMEYASRSFALTRDERTDADVKADAYVDLARAVLFSRPESEAYFNEAVEVASKIGDENLDRWTAMLDLADRAADPGKPAPEIAYRLARCAELTYDYVVRDEHFNWDTTVRSIAGLCPSSSITILSRWRDRDFGWAERLLPIAMHCLVERHSIDPIAALSLLGFRAQWDETRLLRSALDACSSKTEKQTVLDLVDRYMRLDGQNSKAWRELQDVVGLHGLSRPDIDELIGFSERQEQYYHLSSRGYSSSTDDKDEQDWDTIFSDFDLTSANDVSLAYRSFRNLGPPYYSERFFKGACNRVSVGKEAEFIKAVSDTVEFDLYHFRVFLEQFPDAWRTRLAAKSALANAVRSFCRRYCMEITKNRYYEALPLSTACELSGITEAETIDTVLSAIGEATEVAGSQRLFTLVGLLASKLSNDEALKVLSFGLDLLESILEEDDGDGPWSQTLAPPADINAAIAGYVWAGLAAPKASLRWEAAHSVRAICTLDRTGVLDHLINLAKAGKGGPFVDARLHFYQLHAVQWLLIALARTAKETPKSLLPYSDFFISFTLKDESHVLIRGMAANAVLTLCDSGYVSIEADVYERLQTINESEFPTEYSKSYDRIASKEEQEEPDQIEEFSFGYDMGPYWFESLGRCFAMSQIQIEREGARVIIDEWGFSGFDHWQRDERHRRKIFRDGETHHSSGSYPRTDDLRFYLSYHAMMIVAGRLLTSAPLHQDPDDPEDKFQDWLSRHALSRVDGNWLADRRDPAPLDWPNWKDEKQEDEWRWSVSRGYFEDILGLPGNRLNLWGHWTSVAGSREETIRVSSALVSSERSYALLRALQTAGNPHDYRIPDADDDLQISSEGFDLLGWVVDGCSDGGIDESDPWAGGIHYPPIVPATLVLDLMNIECDSENRIWRLRDSGSERIVLWSQIWGCYEERDHESETERGRRLQTELPFVVDFLKAVEMDLIVKVEIRRELRRSRYERRDDYDVGYLPPYFRLFIVKSDGQIIAI
jgi:hypothetical protein